MSLIRLCYVSRAAFKPYTVNGMDQQVAGILSQSRINNQRRNLVGALYYANGVFFQCLEGEESAIDQLMAQLLLDSRHTDLQVLSRLPIRERAFQDWEMKYAMLDREIRQFLREQQLPKFDPYKFTPAMTAELVKVLLAAQDVETEALPAVTVYQPRQATSWFHQPICMLMVGMVAGAGLMELFGHY